MSVIALSVVGDSPSVITDAGGFSLDGQAVLIRNLDREQLRPDTDECNTSYDLRVGNRYRDYRDNEPRTLTNGGFVETPARGAVIIRTKEEVYLPKSLFGHVLPRVSLLQKGIANTPTKIDPGYRGPLLVTTFNHGRRQVKLRMDDAFCSMYLSTTQGGVIPYNKASKDLDGEPLESRSRAFRDFVERNSTFIQIVHGFITVGLAAFVALKGGS